VDTSPTASGVTSPSGPAAPTGTRPVIWWLPLGERDYLDSWRLQKTLVEARRRREVPDVMLTVEHPHVITTGRSTHSENLLSRQSPDGALEVPVVEVERGGDVTYHGPGQLVAYFLFDLEARNRDLHRFLRELEEVQIRMLATLGISSDRREGKTGVWVGDRKLGSIGLAVRHWVTYHGFALNLSTDLRYFSLVNPCGFEPNTMTSVSSLLGRTVTPEQMLPTLRSVVEEVFERPLLKVGEKRVSRIVAAV
jgi:lipoyl(octanoyl) transferase